jgi:hypothetical protein
LLATSAPGTSLPRRWRSADRNDRRPLDSTLMSSGRDHYRCRHMPRRSRQAPCELDLSRCSGTGGSKRLGRPKQLLDYSGDAARPRGRSCARVRVRSARRGDRRASDGPPAVGLATRSSSAAPAASCSSSIAAALGVIEPASGGQS